MVRSKDLSSIPTSAEFGAARQRMAERDRNWDEIAQLAKARLSEICDLREFAIFPNDVCRFSAILFLPEEGDAIEARKNGLDTRAREVLDQVIRRFRANECAAIEIHVEVDSDENVGRNYGGYFNRLR